MRRAATSSLCRTHREEDRDHRDHHQPPPTLAEALDGLEPMGDLSRFIIDDLTPDEEDEFFLILEEA